MLRVLPVAAVLALSFLPLEVGARSVFRAQPFLVPHHSIELNDETRPAANDVTRSEENGSVHVDAGPVRIPPKAKLEAWFGLGKPSRHEWRFTLRVTTETEERQASEVITPSSDAVGAWKSLELDLASLVGQEARVELRAMPAQENAPGKPVLGPPRLLVETGVPRNARNVILVSLDTLRADRLSSYGAERLTSPKMDALAAEGVRFETALAPASSTPPSHMTMLTGTSPCRHGVWGVHPEDDLPEEIETLAEALHRDGYTTAAVTENAYVAAPYGFARGFDSYEELKQMSESRNSPSSGVITPTGYAPKTFAAATEWLEGHTDRQFLLFIHTYQVHGPRRPAGPYASLFSDETPAATPGPKFDPPFHDLRRYDQLVRQLDDLVGALTDQLRSLGLERDTILILTSDHGEAFFEHGDHGHGWSVYGEVLRVPLIVWAPGLARASTITAPVGLIDLTPTILDLVGQAPRQELDGRSLAGVIRGDSPALEPRTYYAETAPGNVRSLRDARFKIRKEKEATGPSLYDLDADPAEQSPLLLGDELPSSLGEHEREIRSLRDEFERQSARCDAQRAAADRARTTKAAADPAREEKLRALGYLE